MKLAQTILTASIASALGASAAHADVTVYITGATAFRNPAVTAIESFLSGGFVGIYGSKSGVTSEKNAANCAFRGTVTGNSALGVVTIKCAWGGSVGGIKLIQSTTTFTIDSQPGVKGWIPDGALPAGNTGGTIFAGTEDTNNPTIIGADSNTYTFESGSTAAKPDAAFSDAFQTSALAGASGDAVGLGTDTSTGKIGVIPFDIVVCNGVDPTTVTRYTGVTYGSGATSIAYAGKSGDTTSANVGRTIAGKGIPAGATILTDNGSTLTISASTTSANNGSPTATNISSANSSGVAPISNINSNELDQIIVGGGRLSMFTGSSADNTLGVYAYGRNADSGTRISCLGESYRGITNRPGLHLLPTFTPAGSATVVGAGGSPGNVVSQIARWPTDTVLGVSYGKGQSGYTSGGDLADALLCPGPTTATVAALDAAFIPRAGWMIGYLGRSDASRACARTFGVNTAKRLTFNGEQDWNGLGSANNEDGSPTGGFLDAAVQEGHYQGWEFEHFFRRASASSDHITVLNALASSIQGASAPSGSIKLDSTFHVTKTVEGGAVSYP